MFSLEEHNECEKLQKKKIWMKGYNRRWALAAIELNKNYKKYLKKYGKLVAVEMFCDSGNSWLGNKHHNDPKLKKKLFLGKKNKYPKWIKSSNKFLYEDYWNGASHFMDLLEFFELKNFKNFKSHVNTKIFRSMFEATKLSDKCLVSVTMSKFKHNNWNEFVTFVYENAKVTLRYNSPMQKGGSCDLEILDSLKLQKTVKSYKDNWHYELQNYNFINQVIKLDKRKPKEIYNGKISIKTYEDIWKNLVKKK